jgi:protoporphyrinogen oxidase
MKIGIVGGGIMGITLGYLLTKTGHHVTIYEASPEIGGLAATTRLADGARVDRFYHAILSSDLNLRRLCAELGVADRLRFQTTKTGFYHEGRVHSMNNIVEFLRFPPLGWVDRFRLGVTVLYAQLIRDWQRLEQESVEDWLVRWSGRTTYENIWRPLLKAKFDGGFEDTPATYIWSRLVRMKSTRKGANQEEQAGHLIGGYPTLLQAMADGITAAGSEILVSTPVQEIMIEGGSAWGVRVQNEVETFDRIVSTLQLPITHRLIPEAEEPFRASLLSMDYLGVIAVLLVLDRPLTGFWTINITDDRYPFTGIIETTAYIDPKYVGGHHLVYLPKYVSPGSSWVKKDDDEIKGLWIDALQEMFPEFDSASIQEIRIHRERFVEPLHGVGRTTHVPAVTTPVRNFFIATTAQIYPQLTNGESVTRFAEDVRRAVLETPETSLESTTIGLPELETVPE